ncbi:MAG: hypothetical protein EX285_08445 [Thaumarchaeota archaeon]|nr:hypothetical protein [Nitrososphaerota archaeon]
MSSKPLIIGTIVIGIAIGYIGGFLTFYNELSNVESVNITAIKDELDSLKEELTKANTKVSLLNEDNEKLRSSLIKIRDNNEILQKRVSGLHLSINDPTGSLYKIEKGIILVHMVSGSIPLDDEELSRWRFSVVNDTAKLDPALVPIMLRLVDSWVDIVEFEENEPEINTSSWNQWNVEWQNKALVYLDAYNMAISRLTDIIIKEIDSLKSLI